MKFKFKIQQYQTDAVEQTVNVFAGQPSKTNAQYRRDLGKRKGQITFEEEYVGWRNNDVELQGHQLLANIQQQQAIGILRFTEKGNGIRLLDEVDFNNLIETLLANLADGESFTYLTSSRYQ